MSLPATGVTARRSVRSRRARSSSALRRPICAVAATLEVWLSQHQPEPLGRVAPGSRVVLDRSVPHPAHGRQQLPPPGQVGRVLGAQQVVDRRARATVDVRRDRQLAQPLTGRSQLLRQLPLSRAELAELAAQRCDADLEPGDPIVGGSCGPAGDRQRSLERVHLGPGRRQRPRLGVLERQGGDLGGGRRRRRWRGLSRRGQTQPGRARDRKRDRHR